MQDVLFGIYILVHNIIPVNSFIDFVITHPVPYHVPLKFEFDKKTNGHHRVIIAYCMK